LESGFLILFLFDFGVWFFFELVFFLFLNLIWSLEFLIIEFGFWSLIFFVEIWEFGFWIFTRQGWVLLISFNKAVGPSGIPPGKLTWNLKITCLKKGNHLPNLHFWHVNFQGCIQDTQAPLQYQTAIISAVWICSDRRPLNQFT